MKAFLFDISAYCFHVCLFLCRACGRLKHGMNGRSTCSSSVSGMHADQLPQQAAHLRLVDGFQAQVVDQLIPRTEKFFYSFGTLFWSIEVPL